MERRRSLREGQPRWAPRHPRSSPEQLLPGRAPAASGAARGPWNKLWALPSVLRPASGSRSEWV